MFTKESMDLKRIAAITEAGSGAAALFTGHRHFGDLGAFLLPNFLIMPLRIASSF